MEEELQIIVNAPNKKDITAIVKPLDPINILFSIAGVKPLSQSLLVMHNGRVLSPSLSFRFLDIKNGDEIHIIMHKDKHPQTKETESTSSPISFPKLYQLQEHCYQLIQLYGRKPDQDDYQQIIQLHLDPKAAFESARLRDHSYDKIEGSALSHRKFMKRYFSLVNNFDVPNPSRYQINPPMKLKEPSTAALPYIWKQKTNKENSQTFS